MDADNFVRPLDIGDEGVFYYSLSAAENAGLGPITRLPRSLKVVLENLLRHWHLGRHVTLEDVEALCRWSDTPQHDRDVPFHPGRILMPDSSGVPLLADLAAMRDAIADLGQDPLRVNPLLPADLVVDHAVIVDAFARQDAVQRNIELEYARNRERYEFLRWAQEAFAQLRVVPSGNGIVHQMNLECLARVVCIEEMNGTRVAYPDTLLGMDSHTPMVNALGVLGWGVGGIEAAAALLGEPVPLRLPEVVGVRLTGAMKAGVTATDVVLTITERLRQHGVVQKFVEFFGPGIGSLPMPARATIANMAPEYGATVGFFPVDPETLDYLHVTGRSDGLVSLVRAYAEAQGLWQDEASGDPEFTEVIEIDLSEIETSIAGPYRPQSRLRLSDGPASLDEALSDLNPQVRSRRFAVAETGFDLGHGDIVLAAITSCTNTSNPHVIIGAALLARNAVARGLAVKPWIKTSFSPGSRVVAEYLESTGLQAPLDALGFHVTGFGCMTCMGNSGPLSREIAETITDNQLRMTAVLSGNRNFEGRVHPLCRLNYLASPPLVIGYALAGTMAVDLAHDPIGEDGSGQPVYLNELWPSEPDIAAVLRECVRPESYRARCGEALTGDAQWRDLPVRQGPLFGWQEDSTFIRRPPYFSELPAEPRPIRDIIGARALLVLGNAVTTDHISPIGQIAIDSPAAAFLRQQGVADGDFNSYAARRANHDVMIRGTFANARLQNAMVPGIDGGYTRHVPDGATMSIFDAAMRYRAEGVPLVVVAGREYGAGSSRDWAAKGTQLLGVRAVIAESFERIHKSNLIGMSVLPLQFAHASDRERLDGSETFDLVDIHREMAPLARLPLRITRANGDSETIEVICRIDTEYELSQLRHGGILPLMLRRLMVQP